MNFYGKIIDFTLTFLIIVLSIIGISINFYYEALRYIFILVVAITSFSLFVLSLKREKAFYIKIANIALLTFLLVFCLYHLFVGLLVEKKNVVIDSIINFLLLLGLIVNIIELICLRRNNTSDEKIKKLFLALSVLSSISLISFLFFIYLLSNENYYLVSYRSFDAGAYQIIGLVFILPLSVLTFLASLVIILIIKNEKWINKLMPIIFILSSCFIMFLPSYFVSNSMGKEYSFFTIEKWEKATCPRRKYMMKNFLHQYDVMGWDNNELITYLGNPDKNELSTENEYTYLYKLEVIEYSNGSKYQVEYAHFDFVSNVITNRVHFEIHYE